MDKLQQRSQKTLWFIYGCWLNDYVTQHYVTRTENSAPNHLNDLICIQAGHF